MRAQLGTQTGQKDRELERLGDVIVRAAVEPEDRIGIGVMAGQHHDRALHALLAQLLAELTPVRIGQAHIEHHQIVKRGLRLLDRLGARAALENVKVLGRHQLLCQRLAQIGVVVDQKDLFQPSHRCLLVSLVLAFGAKLIPDHGRDKMGEIFLTHR